MNKTERIIEDAMDQAMPEHGEGWDDFTDRVKSDMREMENQMGKAVEILRWFTEGDEPIGSDAELIFKMNKKIKDFLA